jgi:membrane protein DedA with SNARE-associated domain
VHETIDFLMQYGLVLVFASVLFEQAGLPVPCTPWLIAAGALARLGHGSWELPILLAAAAASLGHIGWFLAGRRWGNRVLRLLCRVSLEPESCVQRTENAFSRHGPKALVVAPFIPGLTTIAPPLAGMSGMSIRRFLLLDGLGDILWASTFVGVGWLAGEPFFRLTELVLGYGPSAVGIVVSALALYLLTKLVQRQRFRRQLRVDRVSPREVKERLDRGDDLLLVDLRHRSEVEETGNTLPGALHISPDELEGRHTEISRKREVVLFCT